MTDTPRTISLTGLVAGLSSPSRLSRQVGWIAVPFAANQALRLGTNIVLAYLLAPEIFGIMLLVNTLRTGTELLSDIGIGQSVVRSTHGEDRRFLDVAWTLQLLRGVLLTILALAVALPVARIYDRPELALILLAVSPVFLLTGLQSPALFLIQRQMRLRARALYDTCYTVFHCSFSIILALVIPSVWALVLALVVSTLFTTVMSYFIGPKVRPRPAWDSRHVHEIVNFGKWIFLSTAVYFAATSYDRLYFVAVLPLTLAGVYSVARTFADMIGQMAQRAGSFYVFPKVAALQNRRSELAGKLRGTRLRVLSLVALASGLAIAGSDQFILLAYDPRYHAAAFMLPILLAGVWFGVLSAFGDAMLMGCGRPAPGAFANTAKFLVLLAGLPLAVAQGSLVGALIVLVAAEAVRWASLAPMVQREGFATIGDDLCLTGLVALVALSAKFMLGWFAIVPSPAQWWAMNGLLHV